MRGRHLLLNSVNAVTERQSVAVCARNLSFRRGTVIALLPCHHRLRQWRATVLPVALCSGWRPDGSGHPANAPPSITVGNKKFPGHRRGANFSRRGRNPGERNRREGSKYRPRIEMPTPVVKQAGEAPDLPVENPAVPHAAGAETGGIRLVSHSRQEIRSILYLPERGSR